jgi:predicted amidohydrolase
MLRVVAALLLVLVASGGARARADEPEPVKERYRTTVGHEERRGPWRVWVEHTSDTLSRALRTRTRVLRQGPGGGPPTLLTFDRSFADAGFRLHESGWVLVGEREGVRAFAPDAAAAVARTDLSVAAPSRFLADGYLALVQEPERGSAPARLHLRWAPLRAQGLGPSVTVAEIPGADAFALPAETQLLVAEEPGAWVVTWMVPVAGRPVHGRARIDRTTSAVKALPAPEGPPTVRVAAVQCPSVLGDVPANTKRLGALVDEAARRGAKVVVLPETAVTGYLSQDLKTTWHVPGRPRAASFPEGRDPVQGAERVPGTSVLHFADLARRLGIFLTVPLLEEDLSQNRPRWFNTVVLVSPRGRVVGHYRKLNPWPHPEQSWAEKGDRGLVTVDTPYGRVGLAICFDVHSVLAPYAEKGLWALLYPIAWVSEDDAADVAWFGTELPQRVKQAGFHLVGANWSVDAPQPWTGHGHSLVVQKDGRVLASARTKVGEEIVLADLPVGR